MRELKFRVWNQKKHSFYYSETTNDGLHLGFFAPMEGGSTKGTVLPPIKYIQQFMGVQDKNGKDIYEGDIVMVYRPENTFVIRFGKIVRNVLSYGGRASNELEFNTFYFEALDDGKAYLSIVDNEFGENDLQGTEIIGNIFETPTLLKV